MSQTINIFAANDLLATEDNECKEIVDVELARSVGPRHFEKYRPSE